MEDGKPVTMLEETFYVLSKKNTVYTVRLSEKGLSMQKESNGNTKTEIIDISDIIGCRCMRSKRKTETSCVCNPSALSRNNLQVVEENSGERDEKDISAYLYIYAYILSKKHKMKSGRKRERMTVTLRFRSFDKYEDNIREAQKWRIAIKCLIRNKTVPREVLSSSGEDSKDFFHQDHNDDHRVLVLLNPKSGPGRGREIFQKRVAPILAEAEIGFDLHITKHQFYARDFVRLKDIYQWRGIVVVGGDGILFEVLNGMLEREDWQRALSEIPVGIIPCGSGNGLAKSIAVALDEPYDQNPMLISTLNVAGGRTIPMDLVRVETKSQFIFSFLSVGWGLLADIDIESERLRAIGGQRFTIWSVARLIGLKTYHGKLHYLPIIGYKSQPHSNGVSNALKRAASHMPEQGQNITQVLPYTPVRSSVSFHDCISQHPQGDEYEVSPITDSLNLETTKQISDELDGSVPRQRLDSYYSANSRHSAYFSMAGSSYRSLVDLAEPIGPRRPDANIQMYGPPSQLPSLTQPVPSNWVTIKDEFVLVHTAYQSHLGTDYMFAPDARPSDGIIWLVVVRAGISRAQLLQFLLGLSSGTHLRCPGVETIPVTAFRLEPDTQESGHITVDGELVDYGPLQAEVFPSMANVMTR